MFAAILLISAGHLSASAVDVLSPQVAAKHVAACGVGTVTVSFDAVPDNEALLITATKISDAQLHCIDKASGFYDVKLPPSVQPRFDAIRNARFAALASAQTNEWLKAHGILGRLPKYEAGVTDDRAFARAIEKLCNAEGAFQSPYGPNTLSPEWASRQTSKRPPDSEPMACLLNVTFATGFTIGFIGNERSAP